VFDGVQATWNLLEPSAGAALHTAHEAGLGVIVKEGLANGRLTGRNDDSRFTGKRRILDQYASKLGCPLDVLALSAVLAQPWADVVLSGAAAVEQLESNVKAIDVKWNGDLAGLISQLAESPDEYWTTRSKLAWN